MRRGWNSLLIYEETPVAAAYEKNRFRFRRKIDIQHDG